MENQELLSQNDDLVREQTDMIRRLEERLGFYEGEPGVDRHGQPRGVDWGSTKVRQE